MGIFANINNPGDLLLLIFSFFVIIGGVLSLFFILYGGLLLILSGGTDEKIKIAVNTIRYSIVGLIAIIITIYLFPILGRLLGLDVEIYANPTNIFDKVKEISEIILDGTQESYLNL